MAKRYPSNEGLGMEYWSDGMLYLLAMMEYWVFGITLIFQHSLTI
jgi:hypothetical protein